MDRDQIERESFPPARRGYDPAAVHQHLRRLADEFEALAAQQRPGSLAEGTSTQVRAILEAAESGAQQLRDDAGREAAAHVERVREVAGALLARLDALQAEADRLLGGLRSTAAALATALDEVSREAAALASAAVPHRAAAAGVAGNGSPAVPDTGTGAGVAGKVSPAAPDTGTGAVVAPAGNGARSRDEAGARLVALDMALGGAPREQTARCIAEHFDLPDARVLLDAVYASAGR